MTDRTRSRTLGTRFVLLTVAALFGLGNMSSLAAPSSVEVGPSQATARSFRTANGIVVPAGTLLPIFTMQAPTLSASGVSDLSQLFDNIYTRNQPTQTDSYRGGLRYTIPNTETNSLLEQYGATGGFYAYNAKAAFGETAQGSLTTFQAQQQACTFLSKQLIDSNGALLIGHADGPAVPQFNALRVPPPNCLQQPGYSAKLIWSNTQAVGGSTPGVAQAIGAVVQVPMVLNVGIFSQLAPSIPIGGAGGHISLLFRPSPPLGGGFSLDNEVPGLAAIAMPFYGRGLDFLRNVPAVDPVVVQNQVEQQVRSSYPTATNVTVPPPNLLYMADEAGSPQKALDPELNFAGITVTVDGVTFALKDINVPAVQSGAGGFGPTVSITSPTNGSRFTPGSSVSLAGSIIGGALPYSYTWELEDGTPLKQGNLTSAGPVTLSTSQLAAISHNGVPAASTVILRVIDNEGAERATSVSLLPTVAPALFLASIQRNGAAVNQAATQAAPASAFSTAAISNYSFGQESGSDYPPYGPGGSDLPGVVPDASGFKSGMLNYGWNSRFSWSNGSAWERDWRDCSLGGGDCTYGVDRADFVYYTGHGSNGGISLPSSVDSSWFSGTQARFSKIRWVGFSSCLTLRAQWPTPGAEPIRDWFNSFKGAHMLLGFNSLMADIAFGGPLVDNMRMPTFLGIPFPWAQRTIREAWVQTAFNMNAGKPAYIYAIGTNGVNPVDNRLPRPTDALLPRPFPVASYHWVWWDV